jgi:hypothetical protein
MSGLPPFFTTVVHERRSYQDEDYAKDNALLTRCKHKCLPHAAMLKAQA